MNAEIVAGTITSKQEAMDYLTWTYFFRRLIVNPTYYQLDEVDNKLLNRYLSQLILQATLTLSMSHCIEYDDDGKLEPTTCGRIASFYYLSHKTLKLFNDTLNDDLKIEDLIGILSSAHEYAELPVRHNEDQINAELNNDVPIKADMFLMDSPHTKCSLLLQAHYCRLKLASSDYITDLKTVMDQCLRVLQAMLDFCADRGWLTTSLYIVHLLQMTCQGHWLTDSDLLNLPCIKTEHLSRFFNNKPRIDCLPRLIDVYSEDKQVISRLFHDVFTTIQIDEIAQVVDKLPLIEVYLSIDGELPNNAKRLEIGQTNAVVELYANTEYALQIGLRRLNRTRQKDSKAYTPYFAKPKDENWILMLGNAESKELMALKRINSIKNQQITSLQFETPEMSSRMNYNYSLYFMSDVYLGLDQQYEIKIKLIAKK